tara:strand:- start:610 stop:744 length:135 start_codon:yes stop_codon:yes gene_type:complete
LDNSPLFYTPDTEEEGKSYTNKNEEYVECSKGHDNISVEVYSIR